MATITAFTRDTTNAFQHELADAVRALCDKHGVAMTGNRASFNAAEIRFTITVSTVTEDGMRGVDAQHWATYAPFIPQLRDVALGTPVRLKSGRGKIAGYNPKKRTFPVVVQMDDGKTVMLLALDSVAPAIRDAQR